MLQRTMTRMLQHTMTHPQPKSRGELVRAQQPLAQLPDDCPSTTAADGMLVGGSHFCRSWHMTFRGKLGFVVCRPDGLCSITSLVKDQVKCGEASITAKIWNSHVTDHPKSYREKNGCCTTQGRYVVK